MVNIQHNPEGANVVDHGVDEATTRRLGAPAVVAYATEQLPSTGASVTWTHLELDPKPHIPYLDCD